MTETEFDQILARADDPTLISGIHHYCDRRCDRCRLSARCFVYRETAREDAARGADLANTDRGAMRCSLERASELMRIVARRLRADLSDNDLAAGFAECEARKAESHDDALVQQAEDYANTVLPIARGLRSIVMLRGDVEVIEAVDTVAFFSMMVASKVARAVHGATDPDYDANEVQGDVNGSAKVARLVIAESRDAWITLMTAGRAAANGVPAKLVQMLDEIDFELATRFPRAVDFVRPGFDDEDQPHLPRAD